MLDKSVILRYNLVATVSSGVFYSCGDKSILWAETSL